MQTFVGFLIWIGLGQVQGSGNLMNYDSNGYSSLMYAVNQQSLRLVNFSTTFSGGLALLGNAILAACGKAISKWIVRKLFCMFIFM